jgi:hypothetical protein
MSVSAGPADYWNLISATFAPFCCLLNIFLGLSIFKLKFLTLVIHHNTFVSCYASVAYKFFGKEKAMAKKMFLFLALAIIILEGAFAQGFSMSVGVGEYFTSDFGGGVESSIFSRTMSVETPYVGGGGFAFIDATYAELSLGIFGAGGTFSQEGGGQQSRESSMGLMGLDIGLLVKCPFFINERLALFPLAGVAYRIMLSAKDADGNQYKNFSGDAVDARDFSAMGFKLGCGLDFFANSNIYIRYVESYGARLSNAFETNADKALLGHGFEMKFSVGYRF